MPGISHTSIVGTVQIRGLAVRPRTRVRTTAEVIGENLAAPLTNDRPPAIGRFHRVLRRRKKRTAEQFREDRSLTTTTIRAVEREDIEPIQQLAITNRMFGPDDYWIVAHDDRPVGAAYLAPEPLGALAWNL